MSIPKFIEKAIEGGYDIQKVIDENEGHYRHKLVFLDPLAWQAVGKVKIYELDGEPITPGARSQRIKAWARDNMHRMIDALAEGRSIDDFLKSL